MKIDELEEIGNPTPDLNIDRALLKRDLLRLDKRFHDKLEDLTVGLDLMEELTTLSREIDVGNLSSVAMFDQMFRQQLACLSIPDKPKGFTFSALISGRANNPPIPTLPQLPFRPPCLIPPSFFGRITNGLLRTLFAIEENRVAEEIENELWQGLWTMFSLAQKLHPLESVFYAGRQLDAGHITEDRFQRIARMAIEDCGTVKTELISNASGFPFPIPGIGPRFMFPCRLDQWNETERAVRCFCTETYHIEEIRNCEPGRETADFACVGDCVEIRGSGFSENRDWGRAGRMSEVLFPSDSGAPIPVSEYLPIPATDDHDEITSGWSDSKIRVAVPEGAVPGDISLRILCRRTNGGRVVDPARCRYPTRLRTRTSESFLRSIGSLSIQFSATTSDGEFILAGGGVTSAILAEACTEVTFRLEVINADSVEITDSTGSPVEVLDVDPSSNRFNATFLKTETDDNTYTVVANNPCLGAAEVRAITVRRDHRVHLEMDDLSILSGDSTNLFARVSCPLPRNGSVNVVVDDRDHGVSLASDEALSISAGATRSPSVGIDTLNTMCGAALLTGTLEEGSDIAHRDGVALLEVVAIDVPASVSANARGNVSPPIMDRTTFSSDIFGPFNATFSADRTQIEFELPTSISIDPITLSPTSTTITARYNGTFSSINFTVSMAVDLPFPFDDGSLTVTFDSTGDLRGEFGPLAPAGLGVTRASGPSRSVSYDVIVVGAGNIVGGSFDGTRLGLGLTLMFDISPPRHCNLPPWFSD